MNVHAYPSADLLEERFGVQTLARTPILEVAARTWERERYEAFRVCYAAMRIVDDLVDCRRSKGMPIPEAERIAIRAEVESRMSGVAPGAECLRRVREAYRIPCWPWDRWTRSMLYDLDHEGFASFRGFLRYAEGAAVAPGAIFIHLCGVRRANDRWEPPSFDVREAARPLAIFCYLVHVIRDFRSDQLANLNYFPEAVLAHHRLTRGELRAIAAGRTIPARFRELVADYQRAADRYAGLASRQLARLDGLIPDRYRASVQLVYGLYQQVHERIDAATGHFTEKELAPTPPEMRERILAVLGSLPGREKPAVDARVTNDGSTRPASVAPPS